MPEIKRYIVQHPLLRSYIKFFWELQIPNTKLFHKLIPQRNINLRFNLTDTPQYLCNENSEHKIGSAFFSGLYDRFGNTYLKLKGNIHMLGVCFWPDALYPFLNIPIVEFKNQTINAEEISISYLNEVCNRLNEAQDITTRLYILEQGLLHLLKKNEQDTIQFRQIFLSSQQTNSISYFCEQNNINPRSLERMYNKYIGISPNTYNTLNRFHSSINQVIQNKYTKLSEIAYDNGYFDQMHFIKDFKRFTGDTPKIFIDRNNSILQIGKLK